MRHGAVLAAATLLLAGCGAAGGTTTTSPSGSTSLTAAPAECTAAPSTTCTVEVTYANLGSTPLTIDAGLTQLVDEQGVVRRALPSSPTSGIVLPAGEKVAIVWSVDLDQGDALADVRWVDPSGSTATVPLGVVVVTPTPTPTSSPTPTSTPKPVVTPKPKPTPSPTRTRTSQPRPASSPPAVGSIG